MDSVLSLFSETKNAELELRFSNLDAKSIKEFLSESENVTKEESINFIQEIINI